MVLLYFTLSSHRTEQSQSLVLRSTVLPFAVLTDTKKWGTICPSPMLVYYIPSCPKTFPDLDLSRGLPCEKRKSLSRKDRTHVRSRNDLVLCPLSTVTLHEVTNYELLSHPSTYPALRNVIYQHGRGTKMFRHQQGAFSFPELQFSRRELHVD